MNGVLWFVAPIALLLSGVMVIVAIVAGIVLNWGRPRG